MMKRNLTLSVRTTLAPHCPSTRAHFFSMANPIPLFPKCMYGCCAAAFVREVGRLLHPLTPDTSISPTSKSNTLRNSPSLLLYIPVSCSLYLTTFQVEEVVCKETLGFLSHSSLGRSNKLTQKQKQGTESRERGQPRGTYTLLQCQITTSCRCVLASLQ